MYKKFIIVTALVLAMAAGLTAAVTQGAIGRHRHHNGWMLHRMTRELNLTDAQQTQIKGILQSEKAKTQPLRQQLRQNQLSQNSAATAGAFDEAQARAFANKQAQIMSDLMVEKARTKSQIFAVLTPDQRQKAQQLMQEHKQRRQHRQKEQSQPQAQPSPS
ncbi:MAG TPA: Spy/CpxP family protein refolding chaperone [Candidatus Angelobacter sp.]|nr:Spy/CpxP family protein refolding chaperone [Candidatus Angelobacter sp.]